MLFDTRNIRTAQNLERSYLSSSRVKDWTGARQMSLSVRDICPSKSGILKFGPRTVFFNKNKPKV